jgi:hypothetical protein
MVAEIEKEDSFFRLGSEQWDEKKKRVPRNPLLVRLTLILHVLFFRNGRQVKTRKWD